MSPGAIRPPLSPPRTVLPCTQARPPLTQLCACTHIQVHAHSGRCTHTFGHLRACAHMHEIALRPHTQTSCIGHVTGQGGWGFPQLRPSGSSPTPGSCLTLGHRIWGLGPRYVSWTRKRIQWFELPAPYLYYPFLGGRAWVRQRCLSQHLRDSRLRCPAAAWCHVCAMSSPCGWLPDGSLVDVPCRLYGRPHLALAPP